MREGWKIALWSSLCSDIHKERMQKVEQEYARPFCFPPKELIFHSLDYCDPADVKVVIIGQDPYHGKNEANGLAFSVPNGVNCPPSLRNIIKELFSDLHVTRLSTDLSDWAEQGVILLNTILTVRENEPLSHSYLNWEGLTNEIICVLNDQTNPIVFVLWGKSAQKKSPLLTNPIHKVITSSHPSPLGAYRGFLNSKPFSQINEFLMAKGREEIKWEDSSF